MRRRLGDRRIRPRFEVVGALGGTLEAAIQLRIRNLAVCGALLESPVALESGAIHSLLWDLEGFAGTVDVRVCHSRPAGAGSQQYLIGVEFLTRSPLLADAIAKVLLWNDQQADLSGA